MMAQPLGQIIELWVLSIATYKCFNIIQIVWYN